jgi:hypothetical protein
MAYSERIRQSACPCTRNTAEPESYKIWFEPEPARRALAARILSLESPADWDGDGAKAISRLTCAAASRFYEVAASRSFVAPRSIAPSTDGAVGFTWEGDLGLINIQVYGQGETDCEIRWSRAVNRAPRCCSMNEAIDELGAFLALK